MDHLYQVFNWTHESPEHYTANPKINILIHFSAVLK